MCEVKLQKALERKAWCHDSPIHVGPDLTSGVTEVSLRKGSFGRALKKEFEGAGEEVQQHGLRGSESQAEGTEWAKAH